MAVGSQHFGWTHYSLFIRYQSAVSISGPGSLLIIHYSFMSSRQWSVCSQHFGTDSLLIIHYSFGQLSVSSLQHSAPDSLLIIHYSFLFVPAKPSFDGLQLRLSEMCGLFQNPRKLGDFLF